MWNTLVKPTYDNEWFHVYCATADYYIEFLTCAKTYNGLKFHSCYPRQLYLKKKNKPKRDSSISSPKRIPESSNQPFNRSKRCRGTRWSLVSRKDKLRCLNCFERVFWSAFKTVLRSSKNCESKRYSVGTVQINWDHTSVLWKVTPLAKSSRDVFLNPKLVESLRIENVFLSSETGEIKYYCRFLFVRTKCSKKKIYSITPSLPS